jgi:hypothetical protein
VLTAFDPAKQEIRWRAAGGGAIGGGTATTAGNLEFQVTPDGRLGNGMGPPITFS